jgi:hypothetical protein
MRRTTHWLGALLATWFALGCGPTAAQTEVGTPAQRYGGRALVVLPRACVSVRSVPQMHFAHRSLEVPAKTERLQAMLDALTPGAPQPIGPRPEAECGPRPNLEHEPSYLTEIRATEQTLRAMRESGASHVVVLELHTEMACMQSRPWSPDDVCLEEEITLTAWIFDEAGAAVWGLTRIVGPTDEPGWVLDRVLDRVPVAEPIHRTRGEYQVAKATSRSTL